jgi:hypothetical protein
MSLPTSQTRTFPSPSPVTNEVNLLLLSGDLMTVEHMENIPQPLECANASDVSKPNLCGFNALG